MSCQLSHRLTTVHRSVSKALLYSVGYAALVSNAQAATIGRTVITSAQHEPLTASIVVTDIKTADFSARLADSTLYQQMGLTPTDSMTVRFQPTSATSGQVFITTTKPISQPFTDVVLAISDGAQRSVIPKTLLMPLEDSLPINTHRNNISAANKLNLPTVSTTNAQPLTLRKGAPPPLLSTPKSSASNLVASKLTATRLPVAGVQATNVQTANTQTIKIPSSLSAANTKLAPSNATVYTASDHLNAANYLDNGRSNTDADTNKNVPIASANHAIVSPVIAFDSTKDVAPINDPQFDILNIKITRQIQLNNNKNNAIHNNGGIIVTAPIAAPSYGNISTANSNSDNVTIPSAPSSEASSSSSEIPYSNPASNQIASQPIVSPTVPSTQTNPSDVVNTTANNINSAKVNYTVQRNDNLWLIAQQIAEKNNLDVQTVMSEIQAQNPNAFINKNADQLKADALLSLPNYGVMPTQKKLKEAINVQRQYNNKANTAITKKPNALHPDSKTSSEKPVTTKTQILPTAQFSVLAPGQDGSVNGTKTKAGITAGNGLSPDVLDILKSSRQSTAAQAQRLTKTNSTLDSYTKKLQLQNQKLAELQAHLEKLRNQ
ncbi:MULTISPECIES: FimV family protein [unclassified Psychrobacter]|uniref:type IV pilus assembly protein FimV n=1 Tax=unclassified Psychrobacter TaxID=196806 RepID=UPI0025D828B1|nr:MULTISPECIES: peptigoglycan-binding protein LysM [unclassified Psychrobacter]